MLFVCVGFCLVLGWIFLQIHSGRQQSAHTFIKNNPARVSFYSAQAIRPIYLDRKTRASFRHCFEPGLYFILRRRIQWVRRVEALTVNPACCTLISTGSMSLNF